VAALTSPVKHLTLRTLFRPTSLCITETTDVFRLLFLGISSRVFCFRLYSHLLILFLDSWGFTVHSFSFITNGTYLSIMGIKVATVGASPLWAINSVWQLRCRIFMLTRFAEISLFRNVVVFGSVIQTSFEISRFSVLS
jgi:hypothetical protein